MTGVFFEDVESCVRKGEFRRVDLGRVYICFRLPGQIEERRCGQVEKAIMRAKGAGLAVDTCQSEHPDDTRQGSGR
jgi:hypothetical protein